MAAFAKSGSTGFVRLARTPTTCAEENTVNYYKAWETAIKEAVPAKGSRADLEKQLQRINEELKGPLSDYMRIELCAERASIKKALA